MNVVHAHEKFPGINVVPFSQAAPHLAAVFLLSVALYLWSTPRSVALEDDGLFILASFFNSIAHPPGYPLYTVFGKLASLAPVSTVAFRVHALSGFFGALSCATLWYIARLLLPGLSTTYLVALAYAVSKSFWSQAIIAEVYTLNVFIFLLLLVQALLFATDRDSHRPMLMAFLYGLGISNHWPLLVLSTPCLLLILWPALPQLLRSVAKWLPFLLLGLTPYLWMVLRSQMLPEISFSGPIDSWNDFWCVFSRKMFADADSSATAGWYDKYQFAGFQLTEFFAQFGWLGFIFVCLGFIRQWQVWPRLLCWAAFAGFIGSSFLLILLLNFDYDAIHRKVFHVYPLISYAFEALWLGLGFSWGVSLLNFKDGLSFQQRKLGWGIVLSIILAVMITNLKFNYRANYDWAEKYAATVLKALPPNAVFFCESDSTAGPLGYLNLIKKVRPDVSLYNSSGVLFNTRLASPIMSDSKTRIEATQAFIKRTQRPVYHDGGLIHPYAFLSYGLFNKIEKDGPPGKMQPVIIPEIMQFVSQPYPYFETDPWTLLRINNIRREFTMIWFYFYASAPNEAAQNKYWGALQNNIDTFQEYLVLLDAMMKRYPNDQTKIKWLLEKAAAHLDEARQKKERADFYSLKEKYAQSKK